MEQRDNKIKLIDAYRYLKKGFETVTEECEIEAKHSICHVVGCEPHEIFVNGQQVISGDLIGRMEDILKRRLRGEPLAYIMGERWFMGLRFSVDPRVLIPRQDTELLAEKAINYVNENKCAAALDLCTGSGCIAIAMANYTDAAVTASDVSQAALEVARKNAQDNGVTIGFVCSDLFEKIEGQFDVITANPPYVSEQEYDTLMREVRCHEPKLALVGKDNGLACYRTICSEAKAHLAEGGMLMMEIGCNQGPFVHDMLLEERYTSIEIIKDWSGLDRVAIGKKKES